MSLIREATILHPGYVIGDIKAANYDITFTLNQLVEPEPGWFLLNGAVISQITYPLLFNQWGTTYNTGGEGLNNFRLPNHSEGVFPIAKGLTNFTSYAGAGGEISHILGSTEIAVHTHSDTKTFTAESHGHSGSISAVNGGDHNHSYTYYALANSSDSGGDSAGTNGGVVASGYGGASHYHDVQNLSYGGATEVYSKSGGVSASSGGSAHNNMMPYIVIGGLLVKHD